MFELYIQQGRSRRKLHRVTGDKCSVGSARSNHLLIDRRGVANRHAEFFEVQGQVFVKDLGSVSGTWANRQRIREYGPLSQLDEIVVGEIQISFHRVVNGSLPHLQASSERQSSEQKLAPGDEVSSHGAIGHGVSRNSQNPESKNQVPARDSGLADTSGVDDAGKAEDAAPFDEEMLYWSKVVHDQLLSDMDLRRIDVNSMSDEQLRRETQSLIDAVITRMASEFPPSLEIAQLNANVLNEAVGMGPLEAYLADDSITEIMVNSYHEIFIEKSGKLEKSSWSFSSNEAVFSVIERIITPIGRRLDESSPIVDARLKDGSRVNAIIPPLALKGPSLTIRKFSKKKLDFDDLIEAGSISHEIVKFLEVCVQARKNIVVSGGTGSGKTTLLNVLSNFIPHHERIVTIEDAAELKLAQPNLVALEAKPPNLEGRGAISIRDLVKNALRMRPDRIVIGECRGGEAIDMLQAMNTGHDGSLTTIHANNPRDVISRIEVLVLMAGLDLPVAAIREQIASAVDVIIQQTRFPCGTRKITRITEVVGVESGTVQLQDIFVFRQTGLDSSGKVMGRFQSSGSIPSFYEPLTELGHEMDMSLFDGSEVSINESTPLSNQAAG